MLLKIRVKAGILLYALLMSAIFALLLQFYLDRVQASQRQYQEQLSASRAGLIAQLTLEEAMGKSGAMVFDQGTCKWERKDEIVEVTVSLNQGNSYRYAFKEKGK